MGTLAYQPQENPITALLGQMGVPQAFHAGLERLLQLIHPKAQEVVRQIASDPNLQFTSVGGISGASGLPGVGGPYSGGKAFPLGAMGYGEQQYPVSLPVRVAFRDGTVIHDEVKGLNAGHALARAYNNWPDALIESHTPATSEASLRQLLQSGPKTPSGPGSLTGLPAERPWVGVKPITAAEGQAPLNVPKSYAAPKTYDLTNVANEGAP